MIRKSKQLVLAIAGLVVLALAPAAAKADATLVVGNPGNIVTVTQGSSGSLNANITNTGAFDISLDGMTVSLSGPSGLTYVSNFIANTPPVLGPGMSTGFVSFFDVFADLTVPPGLYLGFFICCANKRLPLPSGACADLTADFSVNVVAAAPADIPEPATMFLLATGLGGAALAKRRAKRKGKTEAGF